MDEIGWELEGLTAGQLLDHAESMTAQARGCEVEVLRIAYQWAVIHGPEILDPAEVGKPGRERARQYGGDGTTAVAEFAAAGLGVRIGVSPYAAGALIADALDLHDRLPVVWSRVQALEVKASYARHVAKATRHLSVAEAGYVDAAVAESADGRIPWTRFETLVDAQVAAAAPALARAKEQAAQARGTRDV